ncbi:MAG: patatin-like phospholipase family protein [Gammaproteobacteria bacterium]
MPSTVIRNNLPMQPTMTSQLNKFTKPNATRLLLLLFVCAVGSNPELSFAEPTTTVAERPKIGLVLGGGGAKGTSHVGVLKVIEELQVPIDVVAGTSMGAIVGGLYASGMSPDQIEHEMLAMDWKDVFNDDPPRPVRPFRRKQDDEDYLVKRKPGFSDGKLKLPLGVIQGQKFALALNRLTLPMSDVSDFDDLPIPFRAVASDIETGEKVVLGSGSLARAIHASMAVPGGFGPVEIDGRLLVDGGISDNLPIDVARDMGADIVIVIDLSDTLKKSEELTSVVSMLGQLSAFLTIRNVQEQLATLRPTDVYIKPVLRDVTSAAFDKVAEGISYGEEAGRAARDQLLAYAVSPLVYADHKKTRRTPRGGETTADFIRFVNNSKLGDDVLAERFGIKAGDTINVAVVERAVARVYGLDMFQSVRYEVVNEGDQTGLVITADEKSWGPDYLQFGMGLSDDLDGDNAWNVAASLLKTNINSRAGEIRVGVQLGERPIAFGEIYQPLDSQLKYFVRPRIAFLSRSVARFDNGEQIDEFRVRRVGVALEAGRLFGDDAELVFGLRRFIGEAKQRIGDPLTRDVSFNNAELVARLTYDTLDNRNFPQNGIFSRVEWLDSLQDLGGDDNYSQLASTFTMARTWSGHTLIGSFEFNATLHGMAPLQNRFLVGGFTDLSGFAQDELSGQQVALARAIYFRRFDWVKFLPAYVGLSLEYGNVYEDRSDISFDPGDALAAGSAFIGLDTVLGPLYLSYGHAERGNDSVYFFLGRVF